MKSCSSNISSWTLWNSEDWWYACACAGSWRRRRWMRTFQCCCPSPTVWCPCHAGPLTRRSAAPLRSVWPSEQAVSRSHAYSLADQSMVGWWHPLLAVVVFIWSHQSTLINVTLPKACNMSKVAGQPPLYGNVSQLVRSWGNLIEICSQSWQLRGNFACASR